MWWHPISRSLRHARRSCRRLRRPVRLCPRHRRLARPGRGPCSAGRLDHHAEPDAPGHGLGGHRAGQACLVRKADVADPGRSRGDGGGGARGRRRDDGGIQLPQESGLCPCPDADCGGRHRSPGPLPGLGRRGLSGRPGAALDLAREDRRSRAWRAWRHRQSSGQLGARADGADRQPCRRPADHPRDPPPGRWVGPCPGGERRCRLGACCALPPAPRGRWWCRVRPGGASRDSGSRFTEQPA